MTKKFTYLSLEEFLEEYSPSDIEIVPIFKVILTRI
jgi:hypothetical protein